jgi:hypothetical protein
MDVGGFPAKTDPTTTGAATMARAIWNDTVLA